MYVTNDGFKLTEKDFLEFANINGYNLIDRLSIEQQRLKQLFDSSEMSKDVFYKNIMLDYSKKISQLIIQDYGDILDNETKTKIENFNLSNDSIVFLNIKDFPEVSSDGKKSVAFARKSEGKVYFPLYDENIDIITFIRQRKQDLVHEIFHIVTKNSFEKKEIIEDNIKIGEYKPGALFEEALVEKSARDFATKHNLVYHPMAQYIPYVKSLELFMKKYDIFDNEQMFNIDYQNIISIASSQEQQQYYDFEYNHILRKMGKNNIEQLNHVSNPKK